MAVPSAGPTDAGAAWEAGRQRLPIDNDALVRLAAAGAALESVFAGVIAGRKLLFRDFPKSGEISCGWRLGLRAAPHD